MIEQCAFGSMSIAGRTYTADLMILPDGNIVDSWWRQAGHRLCVADIQNLVAVQPDIIIAGTGIYGMMRVSEDLALTLSKEGIQLLTMQTQLAVKAFNGHHQAGKKVAGCFHLTC